MNDNKTEYLENIEGRCGGASMWASLECMEGITPTAREWSSFIYRDQTLLIGTESDGNGRERFVFNHPSEWDEKNNRPKRVRRNSKAAIELEARNVIDRELDKPSQEPGENLDRLRRLEKEAVSPRLSPAVLDQVRPLLKKLSQEMIVDSVPAGKDPVAKVEDKERDAKTRAYDAIAGEAGKIGRTDQAGVLEFWREAVDAQAKLGPARSLLKFVLYALDVLVTPVTPLPLQEACSKFEQYIKGRNDIALRGRRTLVWDTKKFVAAMIECVRGRKTVNQPSTAKTEIRVDEVEPDDIQQWVNTYDADWKRRRDLLDEVRAFLVYCRDTLHALPPALKTAAHDVPRPKPDGNAKPGPAPVLSFRDAWRMFINLQDRETVWFFAIGLFADVYKKDIVQLDWKDDLVWDGNRPVRIFVASDKGKDMHGERAGQFIDVPHPLDTILGLGHGRTGKIFRRKNLADEKLARIAVRLKIAWDGNMMRRTFASNVLGLGLSVEEASRRLRNPVEGLKCPPIPKPEAQRYFTLPIGLDRFAKLPLQERFWTWEPLNEFQFLPDGTTTIIPAHDDPCPSGADEEPRVCKRVLKKREKRIAWPDDLELQVALWQESQSQIGRELGCGQTTVSQRALTRGLVTPKSDYFVRLKHGLPVEIPEAVMKAREALLARKNTSTGNGGEGSAPALDALAKTKGANLALAGGSTNAGPNAGSNPS